jgi:paraquat-inducible protein B
MPDQVTQNEQPESDAPIKGPEGLPEKRSGVPLRLRILAEFKKKVEKMFEEAVEDPNSDANELVHILLLEQLTNMPAGPSGTELKTILGQQQKRQSAKEHWKLAVEKEKDARKLNRKRRKLLEEQVKAMRLKIKSVRRKMREAQQTAKEAIAAQQEGHPMDALEVYNRIAEIVGLRSPLKPIGPAFDTSEATSGQ